MLEGSLPTKEGYYWVKQDGVDDGTWDIVRVLEVRGELFAWTFTDERSHDLSEFIWIEEVKGATTANE